MRLLTHAALALGLLILPTWAEDAAPPNPAATSEFKAPWVTAEGVLSAILADVSRSGITGVGPHVADIEKTLDEGHVCFPRFDPGSGTLFVLTDGMMETLIGLGEVAANQKDGKEKGRQATAVNNPYPILALYLGSYYNEMNRNADALRILDKGMTLMVMPSLANHTPYLASERALSLARLGRLPEALAAYDEGLKLPAIDDKGKARMQRGRGYVLTEMNRLDDAEAAYKESLVLDAGNRTALGELQYIAKLKAGGEKAPGSTTLPNAPPKAD